MNKHTLFIADLHLHKGNPNTTKLFAKLIDEINPQTDALYILGDLFQFWAGDDDRSPFNEEIKNILKKISSKIPVYLMSGNRDFLLGETFAKESGCALIADPYLLDLYGKKTLLTHGDLLCTKDIKYRVFRSIIRLPYGLKIFLMLPLAFRKWFAKKTHKYSQKSRLMKNKKVLAPQLSAAKKLLTKFNASQIIHGHIHLEEIEELIFNDKKTFRISLGEWNMQNSILIYQEDHRFAFKNLSINLKTEVD